MEQKQFTKATMHLGRINQDIKLYGDNMVIEPFDTYKNEKPIIPNKPAQVFKQFIDEFEGLYIHGGKVHFKGELKNLFQVYDSEKLGFTENEILWCKLRFSNGIITILILEKEKDWIPLCSHDGNKIDWVSDHEILHTVQLNIMNRSLKHIIDNLPLPNPAYTYQIL